VLIVHGEKDNLIPYSSAIQTHRVLENSSLLSIPDAKHSVGVEFKDEVHPKIITFIKG